MYATVPKKPPVWVLGGGEAAYTDFYESITPDWISEKPQALRTAADATFALAGVSRDDIDVAISLPDLDSFHVQRERLIVRDIDGDLGVVKLHAIELRLCTRCDFARSPVGHRFGEAHIAPGPDRELGPHAVELLS